MLYKQLTLPIFLNGQKTTYIKQVHLIVYRVLNHSEKAPSITLIHLYWPIDVNVVLSILYQKIMKICESNPHPDILYLQADNALKDGKNWVLFAYLSWLIHLGWF